LLPVMWEFPQELQRDKGYWRDSRNWKPLLPNLGRSIDPQRLIDDYRNNGIATDEAEQIWASQHLNIEIGVGIGDERLGAVRIIGTMQAESRRSPSRIFSRVAKLRPSAVDVGGIDDLSGSGCHRPRKDHAAMAAAGIKRGASPQRASGFAKISRQRLLDCQKEGSLTICRHCPARSSSRAFGDGVRAGDCLAACCRRTRTRSGLIRTMSRRSIEELIKRGVTDEMLRSSACRVQRYRRRWWGLEHKLCGWNVLTHGGSVADGFLVRRQRQDRVAGQRQS
jgi:hypothetical protein